MSGERGTATLARPRPSWSAAAPFGAVALIGLVSTALPPYHESGTEPWVMVGAVVATVVLLAVSIRRRRHTWVDPLPAYAFFVVVALSRDLSGGATSGLAPLVVLPILWLALTGTRRQLMVAAVLTGVVFLGPIIAIGPPLYPFGDWRRAALWTAFAFLVAPVIQSLVGQLARETQRARDAASETDAILRDARQSGIISTQVDGVIRSFSAGAETLLGYEAADLVGRETPGAFHEPTEIAAVAEELGVEPGFAVFAELARLEAPSRIWTYVRQDGSHLKVRLAITDLRSPDGEVTGYLGVAIDATAAEEAQQALALSEAQWRVLMEQLPDMTVIMLDEEHRIRVIGGGGAMRQGLRGTEGRPLSEVSNPSNLRVLTDLLNGAFAGREGRGELRSSATGAEHEVFVTSLPPDHDGGRAMILARDVSSERRRQAALEHERRRAERLFSDAPHGVAVLDHDGVVLQANAALRALVGAGPGDLEGRHFSDLGPPGDPAIDAHLDGLFGDAHWHRHDRRSPSPEEAQSDRPASTMVGARSTDCLLRDLSGGDIAVGLTSRVLPGEDDALDAVLVNVVDLSERRLLEDRLAHLADHDPLTGLPNRRRFDAELGRHLDVCSRYGAVGAVLLLDLDHFKDVNDTLGHGAGDQLLVSVASLLRRSVRKTDVVARLGGDEFAILLTAGDQAAAETVAASVVTRIREHAKTLDGTRQRVTASVGVVTVRAASGQTADLLALADMTMYDAKDAGRDQFVALEEGTVRPPRLGARLHWQSRIEQALATDDFALLLQPIQDLRSDTVGAAEVLLRMRDGDELIPPSHFLYIAERAGLMPRVDAWVIEHSIALLADLHRHLPGFRLEVNLSGLSIGDPLIETTIIEALATHDVDPSTLILEITETAAVADVELARAFAQRMTATGCHFALDDFGAGFGSFYYLKHLLFDYVKIDGEFVATCHRSTIDRAILRSVVGIAKDLGKQTVAEFVSDPAILEVVRAEGVDHAQGYLLGKPMDVTSFLADFGPPCSPDGNASVCPSLGHDFVPTP